MKKNQNEIITVGFGSFEGEEDSFFLQIWAST